MKVSIQLSFLVIFLYVVTSIGQIANGGNRLLFDESIPKGISVYIVSPKEMPTLSEINSGTYKIKLRFENNRDAKVLLWPFMEVEVLNEDMSPADRAKNIGRFGAVRTNSLIESIKFVELPPGKSHEIEVVFNNYRYDPIVLTGWKFGDPGKFHVRLNYQYDREKIKKLLGKGCPEIDQVDKPWNQALEIDKKETLKLNIKAK